MSTCADLVSATEAHLMAGDRDTMNTLASAISSTSATSITLTYDLNGIQAGAYIAIDLELLYVFDVSDTSKTATVARGWGGSIAATHSSGALVYVNPKVSKFDIFKALNVDLADISPELFQVATFDLTTQSVQRTYTIPTADTGLLDVLEVRYIEPGAQKAWIRIPRSKFQVLREFPTTGDGGFTTGFGLRLDESVYPGRTMRVIVALPFTPLVNLTDDLLTVSGLPVSMQDIPPLGAAARLMGVREAKRAFVESEVDSRRGGEVPPGSASRAAQVLLSLHSARVRSEASALRQQYPSLR